MDKSEQLLSEISKKLDTLIRLNAANVINHLSFKEQVRLLSSVGLQPREIANIVGKTSNNVRVMLSFIRKQGKGRTN